MKMVLLSLASLLFFSLPAHAAADAKLEVTAKLVEIPSSFPPDDLSLDRAIAVHVQAVLQKTDGNKSEASRVLGISRSRLQRYVDRFDLDVPD